MRLELFSIGTWNGLTHYECNICASTAFTLADIHIHIQGFHPGMLELGAEQPNVTGEFIQSQRVGGFKGTVGLSAIFWRNDFTAWDSMNALLSEALRLCNQGIRARIYVASGETSERFHELLAKFTRACTECLIPFYFNTYEDNVGSSVLRNYIIDESKGVDYLFFSDGDIEVVPYSTLAMVDLLESNNFKEQKICCLGASSEAYSNLRENCTTQMWKIHLPFIKFSPFVAWTQYGMFNRRVLDTCRFEVEGPLGGPGWGFEDDDIAMQMRQAGYRIANFRGMCYLHRNIRSSITNLRNQGGDPVKLFVARKEQFMAKWKGFHHNIASVEFPKDV